MSNFKIQTMNDIINEVIKRADEDLVSNSYHQERADSHFRNAVYNLLSATDTILNESDYSRLVLSKRLNTISVQSDEVETAPELAYHRIIGGYFVGEVRNISSVVIVPNINDFTRIIENPLSKYHNVIYVHLFGRKLIVNRKAPDTCYLKYIIELAQEIFNGKTITEYFSMRFILSAIEIAVVNFKVEFGNVV